MRKIIRLLAVFPECGIVTVALPPAFDTGKEIYGRDAYVRLRLRFVEKIGTLLAIAEAEGKKLALEIMPAPSSTERPVSCD
jgi:sugar phosphate isomerase/epimerase